MPLWKLGSPRELREAFDLARIMDAKRAMTAPVKVPDKSGWDQFMGGMDDAAKLIQSPVVGLAAQGIDRALTPGPQDPAQMAQAAGQAGFGALGMDPRQAPVTPGTTALSLYTAPGTPFGPHPGGERTGPLPPGAMDMMAATRAAPQRLAGTPAASDPPAATPQAAGPGGSDAAPSGQQESWAQVTGALAGRGLEPSAAAEVVRLAQEAGYHPEEVKARMTEADPDFGAAIAQQLRGKPMQELGAIAYRAGIEGKGGEFLAPLFKASVEQSRVSGLADVITGDHREKARQYILDQYMKGRGKWDPVAAARIELYQARTGLVGEQAATERKMRQEKLKSAQALQEARRGRAAAGRASAAASGALARQRRLKMMQDALFGPIEQARKDAAEGRKIASSLLRRTTAGGDHTKLLTQIVKAQARALGNTGDAEYGMRAAYRALGSAPTKEDEEEYLDRWAKMGQQERNERGQIYQQSMAEWEALVALAKALGVDVPPDLMPMVGPPQAAPEPPIQPQDRGE